MHFIKFVVEELDSNEHMLLKCDKAAPLLNNVVDWIREFAIVEYEIGGK